MGVREIVFDPLTRIEGHMGIHAKLDENKKKVLDSYCYGTMFRGFEMILKNRDPPDSIFLTQRICGVCSVVHGYTSTLANDMALNSPPPPLAISLRNFIDIAEIIYDHSLHLFQLAGPDYSENILRSFNSSWIIDARSFKCIYRNIHGYRYIHELFKNLNPFKGKIYLFTLKLERKARKLASYLGGKHPHVSVFVPGGIARSWTTTDLQKAMSMLSILTCLSKLVVAVWEDVSHFLYEIVDYKDNGIRRANLISFGSIEDPLYYDAKYEDMDEWGIKRRISPGIIINGKLLRRSFKQINLGVREYVKHSLYIDWDEDIKNDLEGYKIAREHPWNKKTYPLPQKKSWKTKYSWLTSPRWQDPNNGRIHVLEAGPIARLYSTSLLGKVEISSPWSEIHTGNGMIQVSLPASKNEESPDNLIDPIEFKWKIPSLKDQRQNPAINTIERNRARAFCHAYYVALAYQEINSIMKFMIEGKTKVWRKFERPEFSLSVGLSEAARGALGHWMIVKDKKIYRYQVITPSAWNFSPRDHNDSPGPVEDSIINSPITEESNADIWTGIDIMRIVRSFDPCLACSVQ